MSSVDLNLDAVRETVRTEALGRSEVSSTEIRLINFHHCAPRDRARHARVLHGLGDEHAGVDQAGLEAIVGGEAPDRPVLLPVFYEGYRDALTVLDLVEREGLVAWFFIPAAFLDVPVAEQHAWAEAHELELAGDDEPRIALTWDELREVRDRGHVIACHTATHCGVDTPDRETELGWSRARLQDELEVDVATLAFLWGTPSGVDPALDAELVQRGYRLIFSIDRIQGLPHG